MQPDFWGSFIVKSSPNLHFDNTANSQAHSLSASIAVRYGFVMCPRCKKNQ